MDVSIYKIENLLNSKVYIGQTNDFNRRVREHKRYRGLDSYIHKAIKKYGWCNFSFEELCKVPEHLSDYMEKFFQVCYDSYIPNGYNIVIGGNVLRSINEETKKKLSKSLKGKLIGEKNPFYGRHHSQESIKKMLETRGDYSGENNPMYGKKGKDNPNYGRNVTDEFRARISKALKGKRSGVNNPNYGRRNSPETIREMSEARKKYWERKKLEQEVQ